MSTRQKDIVVKAQRRVIQTHLRRAAGRIVSTITLLSDIDARCGLPENPYREILGAVEEYYNQLADEFDDMPGEPPMSSVEEAFAKARALHAKAKADAFAPFGGTGQVRELRGILRNAGPNGDSAGDLLGDAIGILDAVHSIPKKSVTLGEYETAVKDAVSVLRELAANETAKATELRRLVLEDPAEGIDASDDVIAGAIEMLEGGKVEAALELLRGPKCDKCGLVNCLGNCDE